MIIQIIIRRIQIIVIVTVIVTLIVTVIVIVTVTVGLTRASDFQIDAST